MYLMCSNYNKKLLYYQTVIIIYCSKHGMLHIYFSTHFIYICSTCKVNVVREYF